MNQSELDRNSSKWRQAQENLHQSHQTQTTEWANQNSKQIHVNDVKRRKIRTIKLWLVLVLFLIDQKVTWVF